jgi:hypothetical protein
MSTGETFTCAEIHQPIPAEHHSQARRATTTATHPVTNGDSTERVSEVPSQSDGLQQYISHETQRWDDSNHRQSNIGGDGSAKSLGSQRSRESGLSKQVAQTELAKQIYMDSCGYDHIARLAQKLDCDAKALSSHIYFVTQAFESIDGDFLRCEVIGLQLHVPEGNGWESTTVRFSAQGVYIPYSLDTLRKFISLS